MRNYRVSLISDVVGTMDKIIVASWYDIAEAEALEWANNHPQHGKYGLWKAIKTEVC